MIKNEQSFTSGIQYIVRGAALLTKPGIRRFVLVPILANIVVFILLTAVLFYYYHQLMQDVESFLPVMWFTAFIAAFLVKVLFMLVIVLYGYSFNLITTLIAAPFYGMLAEKVEEHLTGESIPSEPLAAMVWRALGRECVKLWYFLSRGLLVSLGLFVLAFIPLLNLLVPVLAVAWGMRVMALQYTDYAADNHRVPFKTLRRSVSRYPFSGFGLGGCIMLGGMIPFLNIVVVPIAVAAGTVFWVNEVSQELNTDP